MKPRPIQDKLQKIIRFFRENKRMPSYSEISSIFEFSSKNAAFRLVQRLINEGFLKKDEKGYLLLTAQSFGLPLLGYVQAGFPSPAEEELVDTLSLDEYLITKPNSSFLLKVTGDSMIDAGIHQGDIAIIERGTTPKSGDIVVAEVDQEWTLKYLQKRDRGVQLIAANKNYPPIIPKSELKIAGIVRGVVRKY